LLAFYLGQCVRNEFKGFQQDATYTIGEMLDDFVADCKQRQLRDMETLVRRVRIVRRGLGQRAAGDFTERDIDLYIKERRALGRASATLTAEMQYLKQAFKLAQRKKLVTAVPHIPRFKVSNARQGFFEQEAVEQVVALLPEYLQDYTWFAYYSGWRRNEIASLEWRDVQLQTFRLRPEISKTAAGRVLMVTGRIAEIVARRRAVRKDLVPYVFHLDGRKIYRFEKAWHKACKEAGVPGKFFHDLRRTAVRNMVRAGVPERIAMQLSGHKTRAVFDRYNIVNEEDILTAQERLYAHLSDTGRTQRKVAPLSR
jgi:integrase